jgi:hypothetical protein
LHMLTITSTYFWLNRSLARETSRVILMIGLRSAISMNNRGYTATMMAELNVDKCFEILRTGARIQPRVIT